MTFKKNVLFYMGRRTNVLNFLKVTEILKLKIVSKKFKDINIPYLSLKKNCL
uniref:Uncharacterized protein n=1 Tax=viral metagenome TaxID=1070528 RepID=A0A6C0ADJ9_9ZZZZ